MRALALAGVLSIAAALPIHAQTADSPLSTAVDPEEGEYLVDGAGMSLYMFKADTQGSANQPAVSACLDDCLFAWPPLLVSEAPLGDGNVQAELLGTLERNDGALQVTYNGWPLYYYAGDSEPGNVTGDDVEDFGEDWYLIGPHGDRPGKEDDDRSGS